MLDPALPRSLTLQADLVVRVEAQVPLEDHPLAAVDVGGQVALGGLPGALPVGGAAERGARLDEKNGGKGEIYQSDEN